MAEAAHAGDSRVGCPTCAQPGGVHLSAPAKPLWHLLTAQLCWHLGVSFSSWKPRCRWTAASSQAWRSSFRGRRAHLHRHPLQRPRALRNENDRAWANIDVLLKQRHDEIPNLVETVKGYMQHEQQTLLAVTQARAASMNASSIRHKKPSPI